MILYMMTTRDKYELPLAVSDTIAGLARMVGEPEKRVYNAFSNKSNGNKPKKWHRVEVDDDDTR